MHHFRNLLAAPPQTPPPPPATYTMLKLAKKFWMQTSSVVCEVGGKGKGLGKCELTKRLKNANVSQDFCP